jgi:hypothetical protein
MSENEFAECFTIKTNYFTKFGDSCLTLSVIDTLAPTLVDLEHSERAQELYLHVIEGRKTIRGDVHILTFITTKNFAGTYDGNVDLGMPKT